MTHTTLSSDSSRTRRLALAGSTALAIVGSFLSFPVAGSKCAPVQHIINILAAVTLGPWYSVGIAFCAGLLRNLLGLGQHEHEKLHNTDGCRTQRHRHT